MKLVFLGTSAAQPTENRGLSCICLERDGEILMLDAGEAAQMSFMKSGLGWNKKMKLFVTHMHGDHCVMSPYLVPIETWRGIYLSKVENGSHQMILEIHCPTSRR